MRNLNPEKKVIFVVAKIPLAYQQAKVLQEQTGCNVLTLCGETDNRHFKVLPEHEVYVITSQTLINLLSFNKLHFSVISCIIMDEVHHTVKKHPYATLIESFYRPLSSFDKPLLIGLTASLANKDGYEAIKSNMVQMCKNMEAKVYAPVVHFQNLLEFVPKPKLRFLEITMDEDTGAVDKHILKIISELESRIVENVQLEQDLVMVRDLQCDPSDLPNYRKLIRYIREKLEPQNNEYSNDFFQTIHQWQRLFHIYEMNLVVGGSCAKNDVTELHEQSIEKSLPWASSLEGLLKEMNTCIENNMGISPRALLLQDILQKGMEGYKEQRTIVFVEMKKTGRWLLNFLKSNENLCLFYKPELIVGSSSNAIDGMEWLSQQKPVLDQFKHGQCKLLIATSVLQEGIDAPNCHRVVLFDKLTSLSGLIQSRGRARFIDSELCIICTKEDRMHYESLLNNEILIKKSIYELIAVQSPSSMKQFKSVWHVCQRLINVDFKSVSEEPMKEVIEDLVPIEKLQYVNNANRNQSQFPITYRYVKMGSSLSEIINQASKLGVKVTHSFLDNFCAEERKTYRMVIENIPIMDSEEEFVYYTIDRFRESSLLHTGYLHLFKERKNVVCNSYIWNNCTFSMGNLVDEKLFVEEASVGETKSVFSISYDRKEINLMYELKGDTPKTYKIEIPFTAVNSYILVDPFKQMLRIEIFVPLNQAPCMYEAMDEGSQEANVEILAAGSDDIGSVNWRRITEITTASGDMYNPSEMFCFKVVLHVDSVGDLHLLLRSLFPMENFGVEVLFSGAKSEQIDSYMSTSIVASEKDLDDAELSYTVSFALNCLNSLCAPNVKRRISKTFVKKLKALDSSVAEQFLFNLAERAEHHRFINLDKYLDEFLETVEKEGYTSMTKFKNENTVLARWIVFTPTRMVYLPPKPIVLNRVLRSYESERFVRVVFRDEDFGKLSGIKSAAGMNDILHSIRQKLDGIKVCKKDFEFLAMSSSQLREHGCWFFLGNSTVDAAEIRSWLGDFTKIKNVAKYVARLGQSLSASTGTVQAPLDEVEFVDDITVDNEIDGKIVTYTFTDGVGTTNLSLAGQMSEYLRLDHIASAYQIRYAGVKGVVAVNPLSLDDEAQPLMTIRPSMKKFESEHDIVDVLNISKIIPAYLNRQIIIILSALGIPDEVFHQFQESTIKSLSDVLTDEYTAFKSLIENLNGVIYQALGYGMMNYSIEPFFRSLLLLIYQKQMEDVLLRTRLYVENARILLGVVDETLTLKEDEVFVQISFEDEEDFTGNAVETSVEDYLYKRDLTFNRKTRVIVGDVVIAKNPCLHPGDVRKYKAVDHPLLKRCMVDVIVFPAVGKRPIPNLCSGSDLDGDLYFVTWDERLIIKKNDEPMNYLPPAAMNLDNAVQLEDVKKFMVNFIANDQLGPIANAHLVHADQRENGVRNQVCKDLAYIFSLAVDFPKTGIMIELPQCARVKTYPDFMQKSDKPMYPSQKVLGHLYRKCCSLKCAEVPLEVQVDPALLVEGYKDHAFMAQNTYQSFCAIMRRLSYKFGLKSEAELITAFNVTSRISPKEDQSDMSGIVQTQVRQVFEFFRKEFLAEFTVKKKFKTARNKPKVQQNQEEDEICLKPAEKDYIDIDELMSNPRVLAKASAWYYVAYSDKSYLSFGWVMGDVLIRVKEQANANIKSLPSFSSILTNSILERTLSKEKMKLASEQYISHATKSLKLMKKMDSDSITVKLILCDFNMLFMPYRNTTMVAVNYVPGKQRYSDCKENTMQEVYDYLSGSIDSLKLAEDEKKGDEDSAPVYKINSMKNLITNEKYGFVISNDTVRLKKSIFVLLHYKKHPWIYYLFRTLLDWGWLCGFLKDIKNQNGMIGYYEFFTFVLHFLKSHGYISGSIGSEDVMKELSRLFESDLNVCLLENVDLLELFYKNNSSEKCRLGKILMDFLLFYGIGNSNISVPDPLDPSIVLEFPRLEQICYNAYYYLCQCMTIDGFLEHYRELKHSGVQDFKSQLPSYIVKRIDTGRLFIEGSSLFLMNGISRETDRLHFDLYKGRKRPRHTTKLCYFPILKTCQDPETSVNFVYNSYFTHFLRQVKNIPKLAVSNDFGKIGLTIRYGSLYFCNLPKLFHEESSMPYKVTKMALQKAYRNIKVDDVDNETVNGSGDFNSLESIAEKDPGKKEMDKSILESAKPVKMDEERVQTTVKLFKRRNDLSPMISAFEPGIPNDKGVMNFLKKHELIGEERSEHYGVSIVVYNSQKGTNQEYFVMYDEELKFKRISLRPLIWNLIDYKGEEIDIRWMISSIKNTEELEEEDVENETFFERLKTGLFSSNNEGELKISAEFRNSVTYIRKYNTKKYKLPPGKNLGDIFSKLNGESDMMNELTFHTSYVTEYSLLNQNGGFEYQTDKCEFELHLDFPSTLDASLLFSNDDFCQDWLKSCWHIGNSMAVLLK
jgi:RNA-dependent RNA polymerase